MKLEAAIIVIDEALANLPSDIRREVGYRSLGCLEGVLNIRVPTIWVLCKNGKIKVRKQ